MVALTFVTGLLDAVGYLGLDRVFTGNMTGNVVILGMGLAGQDSLPVAGPLAALGGYLAVTDMTTVVVTSTLTAYAGETLFSPGFGWLRHRRFWAIFAIFAGALCGALMLKAHSSIPVLMAAVISAGVAVTGHRWWESAQSDSGLRST